MQKIPTARAMLAPTSRAPTGYSWSFLIACIWQGVPTIPTLSRPKLRVASLIIDTFGLMLYLVPAAAIISALVLTIAGIGLHGSIMSQFELSSMIFDGFFAANSLVA